MHRPRVSLCTCCRGRLWQLKQTLPENLKRIEGMNVDICIFDDNSPDGLNDWIVDNYGNEITDRAIRYFRGTNSESFHVARAKNNAYRLATGQIVVNLDADNVIGNTYIETIQQHYLRSPLTVHHAWSGDFGDGTCGRIAMARELFRLLGGYDESFHPMGFHDLDLINRAETITQQKRVESHDPECYGYAIPNTVGDKMQHVVSDLSFDEMNQANYDLSARNHEAGRWKANA